MQKVNPEGAERSLKARQNARLTPNEVSYSALINAYAQKGDPEGAKRSLTYREVSKKCLARVTSPPRCRRRCPRLKSVTKRNGVAQREIDDGKVRQFYEKKNKGRVAYL